jgi:hypothetical protein
MGERYEDFIARVEALVGLKGNLQYADACNALGLGAWG